MSIPRLSFDVDGTLANLHGVFVSAVNRQFHTHIRWQDCHSEDLSTTADCLFSKEQINYGRLCLESSNDLWGKVKGFADVDFAKLNRGMMIGKFNGYFVTTRPNGPDQRLFQDSSYMSRSWLRTQGLEEETAMLTIPLIKNCASLMHALGIDAHLDDSQEAFYELNEKGIPCFLIDRPWNQGCSAGELRVRTPEEFVRRMLRDTFAALPRPPLRVPYEHRLKSNLLPMVLKTYTS